MDNMGLWVKVRTWIKDLITWVKVKHSSRAFWRDIEDLPETVREEVIEAYYRKNPEP